MTEGKDNETPDAEAAPVEPVKPAAEPAKENEAPAAEPAEGAEEKSINAKAFTELKSTVENLAKSVEKINAVLEKAIPAAKGAENPAQVATQNPVDTKSQAIGTLDMI